MKIVGLTDKNEYKEDYRRLKAHDERYPGIAEVAKHPAAKRPFIPDVAGERTDIPEICHREKLQSFRRVQETAHDSTPHPAPAS